MIGILREGIPSLAGIESLSELLRPFETLGIRYKCLLGIAPSILLRGLYHTSGAIMADCTLGRFQAEPDKAFAFYVLAFLPVICARVIYTVVNREHIIRGSVIVNIRSDLLFAGALRDTDQAFNRSLG